MARSLELARLALPSKHSINELKYFTARVSGVAGSGATARQCHDLNEIGTFWKVEAHLACFGVEDDAATGREPSGCREAD